MPIGISPEIYGPGRAQRSHGPCELSIVVMQGVGCRFHSTPCPLLMRLLTNGHGRQHSLRANHECA